MSYRFKGRSFEWRPEGAVVTLGIDSCPSTPPAPTIPGLRENEWSPLSPSKTVLFEI